MGSDVRTTTVVDTIDAVTGGNRVRERFMFKQDAFHPTDLVLFVWPTRASVEDPRQDDHGGQDAAGTAWAMDRAKADRVRVLVSVMGDMIVGTWRVTGSQSTLAAPAGKTRRVNRARFDTRDDPRLHYLRGLPSQVPSRRNPQTTIELRDLFGSDSLLDPEVDELHHGVVRIGDFTLTVLEDGTADLVYPARAALTLRPDG